MRLFFLVGASLFIATCMQGQVRKIDFRADNIEFDKDIAQGAFRLWDNVVFEHEGSVMTCDSAYYYPSLNSLDAFSNVYINQGDTLHLYGDVLYYSGDTRLAQVEHNVRLINKETNLSTSKLDFDLKNSIGFYENNARIINGENRLRSRLGYYYSSDSYYLFRDSVVVETPSYTIYSDTMKYNTQTDIAYFFGPTEIIGDSNYIYCERGWYNTVDDIGFINQNAHLKNEKQLIKADTLYYERETGDGLAYSNVEIFDFEQHVILTGNYARYNEKTEEALLTHRAVFIQVSENDSVFVHADTLRSVVDTNQVKTILAYYRMRLYRNNMQAMCDSMAYNLSDSTIRLYVDPVLWSEENQMSANFIEIQTGDQRIDKITLWQMAFIVSQEDTSKFNQIKGRNMTCHFSENELYRIDVDGNGQTIYYVRDDDDLVGVNKAESSDLIIFLENKEVSSIKFINQPKAILYPPGLLPPDEKYLNGFRWLEKYRPLSKEDIFIRY